MLLKDARTERIIFLQNTQTEVPDEGCDFLFFNTSGQPGFRDSLGQDHLLATSGEVAARFLSIYLLAEKGDLISAPDSYLPQRLPAGADGYLLSARSSEYLGLAWASPAEAVASLFSGRGSLLVGIAEGYFANLPVGEDDQVLTADSSSETGLAWKAVAGGGTSTGREFCFIAEFPNFVLYPGTGSDNTGTLTAAYDADNRRNYYNWTTSQATTQSYDIVVQFRLPPEFSSWKTDDANVYVTSMVTDTSGNTGVALIGFYDASGTNRITASTKKNATWTEDAYAISGGNWSPGDLVTIQVRLYADTNDAACLHAIRIPWQAG
jgi:hypothetical protein